MSHRRITFVVLAVGLLAGVIDARNSKEHVLLEKIDHLVYATPDLDKSVKAIERLLGVRPVPGGQHPGAGTRNLLVGLGDSIYLEIIGPDPDQPNPPKPRRFGIDELKAARLATWAAKGTDLERIVRKAEQHGMDLGTVQPGSRLRPDGVLLSWRFTVSPFLTEGGVLPFFIDWGDSQHPARSLPQGCSLVGLRAEHPAPKRIESMARSIDLDLRVTKGAPALIATISTPAGTVELR